MVVGRSSGADLDRRAGGPTTAVRSTRLVLALAAGLWLGAAPAFADPTIRIATEGAYPPFNYVENNEPTGFEIDLGRALCEAMKASCSFVLQDWDGMISGLKERRYDAILSSMEITEDRRRRIAFSKRYYQMPSALIGPKGARSAADASRIDLDGKSVGTTADSEFVSFLEAAYKGAQIRSYANLDEANLDLLTGRIDYVLGDKLALSTFLAQREGLSCCRFVADMPVDRGEGVGIGLRRGDTALLEAFNAAIDAVIASGAYDRIRARYFTFDIK